MKYRTLLRLDLPSTMPMPAHRKERYTTASQLPYGAADTSLLFGREVPLALPGCLVNSTPSCDLAAIRGQRGGVIHVVLDDVIGKIAEEEKSKPYSYIEHALEDLPGVHFGRGLDAYPSSIEYISTKIGSGAAKSAAQIRPVRSLSIRCLTKRASWIRTRSTH
jgi:hypothetical protein